ncbi:TRAP transporter small permease subunit [Roseovarius pacificus]|uniref:TRAP transporter small permease subunit n=1 Tax=Roseovarius pacificus TaxID=337701 RepID=UPI002A189452|nr:TRAP transporter small permease subunit [Roseovarius pacificus]
MTISDRATGWPGALAHILDRLTVGIGAFASILFLPLVLVTLWEVIARKVLGVPTSWSFEMGYMLTGTYFLLGGAVTLLRNEHVRIDLLYSQFGPRGQAIIDLVFLLVLFLPFCIVISHALWTYSADAFESGRTTGKSAWNPVAWPFRSIMFAAFVLLGIQVAAKILHAVEVLISSEAAK